MQTLPEPYRFSRREYRRLGELGFFAGRRVELIEGQIIAMSPKGPRHRVATKRAERALERVFPSPRFTVWTQEPLALGPRDEPEPDVAVVEGPAEAALDEHPAGALLVVEVADATLAYDLGRKADLYAAAGILDYWVVDIPGRVLQVCRRPAPDPASETGSRYAERRRVAPDEAIAPLAAPDHPIHVMDLLP